MEQTIVLKKYANRRLYDTEKSAYVTLNQLADYIKAGRQVVIYDAKTKEDVTAFILMQIVLEAARNKNALLPAPLLHLVIQYGDNLLGEFFEKYLHQVFENFVTHKQAMDGQFQHWLKMGLNMSEVAQESMKGMNPFRPFFDPRGEAPPEKEE